MSRRAIAIAIATAIGCKGKAEPPPTEPPPAPFPAHVAHAPTDAADGTALPLAAIAEASFHGRGVLRVPPGTTVQGHGETATLTLPTGSQVVLREHPHAGEVELRAPVGLSSDTLLRQGPTWYVFAIPGGGGLMIGGATWGAPPALDIAVPAPADRATFETVVQICASLAAP